MPDSHDNRPTSKAAAGARGPQTGDAAPDAPLTATDGSPVLLSQFWSVQPIVLVFLRHYGCTFCREQAAWLRRDYARFRAAGAEVVCIGQGDPKTGKAFQIMLDLPYPLLVCGEDLSVYSAYGLARGSFGQLFGWRSVVRGVLATLQGHFAGRLSGDGFQMPGAFLIDRSGVIRFAHRHKYASDNIDDAVLFAELAKIQSVSLTPSPSR